MEHQVLPLGIPTMTLIDALDVMSEAHQALAPHNFALALRLAEAAGALRGRLYCLLPSELPLGPVSTPKES